MKTKTTMPETCYRSGTLRTVGDKDDRTVELSFASDAVVDRGYFREQLVVSAGAVRLERLKTEGALKLSHFGDQVGKVREVRFDGGKLRARVEMSRSQRALEVLQDIRDEIRTGVSVAYVVHDAEDVPASGGPPLVRVTDWEPIHISLEAEPADITVGTTRSRQAHHHKEDVMSKQTSTAADAGELQELRRRDGIRSLAAGMPDKLTPDVVERHIECGTSLEEFRMIALDAMAARSKATTEEIRGPALMGLKKRDVQRFSILRLLRHLADPASVNLRQAAAYDLGICREWSEQSRRSSRDGGATLPPDVFLRTLDYGAGTGTGAGLVGTDHLASEYIDALRPHSIAIQLCRKMDGLIGNVSVPFAEGVRTAGWVGEDEDAPTSNASVANKELAPKSLAVRDYITRKMLIQSSPSAEQTVLDDLLVAVGSGMDLALLMGSGEDNQPRGIVNTTGVNSVTCGGADGAPPDLSDIVNMETAVAEVNANAAGMAYIVPALVRGFLKTTEKSQGTGLYVWEDLAVAGPDGVQLAGTMNGYRAFVSNHLPTNGTVGNSNGICSALVFGNFQDAVVGTWGGMDINVDRSSASAKGGLWLVVFQDADVLIRRPQAFAVIRDALC